MMETIPENQTIDPAELKKYALTATTNETYGQFYKFRQLLEAQKNQGCLDLHETQHDNVGSGYIKDDIQRAGFQPKGLKTPALRYGLGISEDARSDLQSNTRDSVAKDSFETSNEQSQHLEEDLERSDALKLPPIDQRFIPKAAGRTEPPFPNKMALPTPNTWWKQKRPLVERPLPPTTGYAKRYMQQSCPRMWQNMETLAGRAVETRLAGFNPDILTVTHEEPEADGNNGDILEYLSQKYGELDAGLAQTEQ